MSTNYEWLLEQCEEARRKLDRDEFYARITQRALVIVLFVAVFMLADHWDWVLVIAGGANLLGVIMMTLVLRRIPTLRVELDHAIEHLEFLLAWGDET